MKIASFGLVLILAFVQVNSFTNYADVYFDPGTSKILNPLVLPYMGRHIFLIQTISSDNLTYSLQNYNMSFNSTNQIALTNFPFPTPLKDCSI